MLPTCMHCSDTLVSNVQKPPYTGIQNRICRLSIIGFGRLAADVHPWVIMQRARPDALHQKHSSVHEKGMTLEEYYIHLAEQCVKGRGVDEDLAGAAACMGRRSWLGQIWTNLTCIEAYAERLLPAELCPTAASLAAPVQSSCMAARILPVADHQWDVSQALACPLYYIHQACWRIRALLPPVLGCDALTACCDPAKW